MRSINKNHNPAIRVLDLSLGYAGRGFAKVFRAVDGVQFDVQKSATLAVLGESGSGKSTLIRYLAARANDSAQKADHVQNIAGEAWTLGAPLHKITPAIQRSLTAFVGYLPQDAGAKLPPDLNVGDLIFEPIEERIKNFDRSELGETVAELFDQVAIPLTYLQKFPYELSKGQRQRVAIVRVLLTGPSVLVLDEPTLGVDANNRPRIVEALRDYRAASGATTLVVSHDIGILEALANDVLVLQQGAMVGYGDINDIFRNAKSGYVYHLAQALRSTAYDEVANV